MTSPSTVPVLKGRLTEREAYPAGEPDVAASYVRLASGENVRVLTAGPADGPPVVLMHGWGCLAYIFRRNVPALAAAGLRVYVPELRGHGFSDKPDELDAYTLPSLTAFAVAVLDALGLERPTLIGHSMSGAVVSAVARAHPDRVAALGLLAPVGGGRVRWGPMRWIPIGQAITPRWVIRLLPYFVGRWTMAGVLSLAYGGRNQFTRRDLAEYAAPTQFPAYAAATRALLHVFDWEPAAPGEWASISVPTLLVFGTRDRFVDGGEFDALRREMPSILARRIDGAGHILPEEVADQLNAMLIDLVRRAGGVAESSAAGGAQAGMRVATGGLGG